MLCFFNVLLYVQLLPLPFHRSVTFSPPSLLALSKWSSQQAPRGVRLRQAVWLYTHDTDCAAGPPSETGTGVVCAPCPAQPAPNPARLLDTEQYRDRTECHFTRWGGSDAVVWAVAATTEVTPRRERRESRVYLLRLLQQLHSFVQDLAVELPALPQDLPPHLLHGSSQILPLRFGQRLARPPAWLLLQGIIQRGFQLLDFLMQPKSHTDRLPFESSKQTTQRQLQEKPGKQSRRQEGRTDTDR